MVGMTINVVFMGSPDFALPTLKVLHDHFSVKGVVTQPDRPAGRGRRMQPPDVKVLAEALGLPLIQPESLRDPAPLRQLEAWSPDVIVVAAYGQILRENVLELPPHGCINVHASLLPRWRGAAPVQAAVLHDEISGVTIMKMDQGLDTGPILGQRSVPIPDDMTAGELFNRLAQLGADLLVEMLPDYIEGKIEPRPQNDDHATYAPRLKKSDGLLDFTKTACFLSRQVRAYHPWPGAFQFYDDRRLKILQAHEAHLQGISQVIPGKCYTVDDTPAWGTGKGLLLLDEVQPAGKQRMSGREFLRGAKDWMDDKEDFA